LECRKDRTRAGIREDTKIKMMAYKILYTGRRKAPRENKERFNRCAEHVEIVGKLLRRKGDTDGR